MTYRMPSRSSQNLSSVLLVMFVIWRTFHSTYIFLGSIILFYMAWMYQFSLNHAKKFKILSFRRNLYTLSGQALLEFSVLTYIMADQLINILIEKYYTDLGPSGVFQCWWIFHLLEKITFLFLKNLWIYHSSKDFHELHGHYGKSFPGYQKPRFMGKNVS